MILQFIDSHNHTINNQNHHHSIISPFTTTSKNPSFSSIFLDFSTTTEKITSQQQQQQLPFDFGTTTTTKVNQQQEQQKQKPLLSMVGGWNSSNHQVKKDNHKDNNNKNSNNNSNSNNKNDECTVISKINPRKSLKVRGGGRVGTTTTEASCDVSSTSTSSTSSSSSTTIVSNVCCSTAIAVAERNEATTTTKTTTRQTATTPNRTRSRSPGKKRIPTTQQQKEDQSSSSIVEEEKKTLESLTATTTTTASTSSTIWKANLQSPLSSTASSSTSSSTRRIIFSQLHQQLDHQDSRCSCSTGCCYRCHSPATAQSSSSSSLFSNCIRKPTPTTTTSITPAVTTKYPLTTTTTTYPTTCCTLPTTTNALQQQQQQQRRHARRRIIFSNLHPITNPNPTTDSNHHNSIHTGCSNILLDNESQHSNNNNNYNTTTNNNINYNNYTTNSHCHLRLNAEVPWIENNHMSKDCTDDNDTSTLQLTKSCHRPAHEQQQQQQDSCDNDHDPCCTISSLRFASTLSPPVSFKHLQTTSVDNCCCVSEVCRIPDPITPCCCHIPSSLNISKQHNLLHSASCSSSIKEVGRSIICPPRLRSPHFSNQYYVKPIPMQLYLEDKQKQTQTSCSFFNNNNKNNNNDSDSTSTATSTNAQPQQQKNTHRTLKSILKTNGRFSMKNKFSISNNNKNKEEVSCNENGTSYHQLSTKYIEDETNTSKNNNDNNENENKTLNHVDETEQEEEENAIILNNNNNLNDSTSSMNKCLKFDARVWVREFEQPQSEIESCFYKADEMKQFKKEALECILRYHQQQQQQQQRNSCQLIATGTSRVMFYDKNRNQNQQQQQTSPTSTLSPILFSHQALQGIDFDNNNNNNHVLHQCCGNEHPTPSLRSSIEFDTTTTRKNSIAEGVVRRILIIDPIYVCQVLFTKSFQHIFPNAFIVTANSVNMALQIMNDNYKDDKNWFDIIVVEERVPLQDNTTTTPTALANDDVGSGDTVVQVPEEEKSLSLSQNNTNRDNNNNNEISSINKMNGSRFINLLKSLGLQYKEDSKSILKGFDSDRIRHDTHLRKKLLFIGCTTHIQEENEKRFIQYGADLVWGKPPPRADMILRDKLIRMILQKRGQDHLAKQFILPE